MQSTAILDSLITLFETSMNASVEENGGNKEPCDVEYMKKVWSKYESIPNSYHTKTIKYIKEQGHTNDDIVWCASEKVHGANFSLITNGVDVLAGSRTQILNETTRFFGGWREVMNAEKDKVLKAFKLLNKKYKNKIGVVIIYGEFFGGTYSHFDKKYMPKNIKCIQDGIFYSPSLHFYAFDIKTDLEMSQSENNSDDGSENEIDGRLSVHESIQIFEECDFLHAKILKQGSFEDMMKFDVDNLQSTVPKLLNLPPPVDLKTKKEIENIAEGVVIRKLFDKDHILLKIKAKRFLEIEEAARQKGKNKKQKTKQRNAGNPNDKSAILKQKILKFQVCDFIERCINDQRLQSVESKVGRLDAKNAKRLEGMFMADVFDELRKEKSKIVDGMSKGDIGKVRAYIAVLVQLFFKDKLAATTNQ